MPCRPISVSLEVDPSATQRILFTLDKTCSDRDEATWKMTFELQEGSPLADVVKLSVKIDPEHHRLAEATAQNGLDANQQGQAQVAAAVSTDPDATEGDKQDALQQVIAVRGGAAATA